MQWSDFTQLLTAVAALTAAIGTAINGYNGRSSRKRIEDKMEVVHQATNGMSEKLQTISKAQGFAEGTAVGKIEGRASEVADEKARKDSL